MSKKVKKVDWNKVIDKIFKDVTEQVLKEYGHL